MLGELLVMNVSPYFLWLWIAVGLIVLVLNALACYVLPFAVRCKKWDVPVEKIYNKTQREKFAWAIDMADEDFEF